MAETPPWRVYFASHVLYLSYGDDPPEQPSYGLIKGHWSWWDVESRKFYMMSPDVYSADGYTYKELPRCPTARSTPSSPA